MFVDSKRPYEDTIGNLKAELERLNRTIFDQTAQLAEKDAQNRDFKGELDRLNLIIMDQTGQLRAVSDHKAEIYDLTSRIKPYEKQIAEMNLLITDLEK